MQVFQRIGKVLCHSHLFNKSFPQFVVIHTVKGFHVVNETDVSLEFPIVAFSMIQQMLAI